MVTVWLSAILSFSVTTFSTHFCVIRTVDLKIISPGRSPPSQPPRSRRRARTTGHCHTGHIRRRARDQPRPEHPRHRRSAVATGDSRAHAPPAAARPFPSTACDRPSDARIPTSTIEQESNLVTGLGVHIVIYIY
ncbi:uncharacterized protein B0H18DRAFT_676089 [Fomitopsis serialis]|uniref:uncharacterized protein n=1 Tax=Fomitopsis serialis TaxID=139415 RepID=UPI0020081670|nr:uncharacterized protein B0H18DRAFT_515068 [Neoantrodia serialis]XP_047897707.1 uncharacterized protein B0H18DRAFT_676089 [Neoantrodia serialis]KAH9922533.1 hypothetical protein B0H18DRAFT_515068 [Neoantrodia serialis]KAH9933072.1 hypothetical protein B0H18DRAFT_676089 [Neoantrodia serialis]